VHGRVPPLRQAPEPSADWVRHVAVASRVPVWMPWPLLPGWVVSGVVPVGDDVSGVPAVATLLSGPRVGFAARAAGLAGPDPGDVFGGPPYARAQVSDHQVPLWIVQTDRDQAVVVGERDLVWIWVVVRPASAGALLVDLMGVADAREMGEEVRLLPYGARSNWLDVI